MLENVNTANIRPASIDLRLAKLFRLSTSGKASLENMPEANELTLPHTLKPGEYVLAQTRETLNQHKYLCVLSARSRAFRLGLALQTNIWGPYYKGPITFGIRNATDFPIRIAEGDSLAQIAFLEIDGDTKPVTHTFQGGQLT